MAWLALMQELTYIGHVFNTFLIGYNISESLFLQAKGKSQVWLLKLCCHLPAFLFCASPCVDRTSSRASERRGLCRVASGRRPPVFPLSSSRSRPPPSPSVRCVSSLRLPPDPISIRRRGVVDSGRDQLVCRVSTFRKLEEGEADRERRGLPGGEGSPGSGSTAASCSRGRVSRHIFHVV